ncbi:MAG: hypothetical protein MMC23_007219 [Stictis urceolatum]|nr:hypothetical protein [Stictis urceolata]
MLPLLARGGFRKGLVNAGKSILSGGAVIGFQGAWIFAWYETTTAGKHLKAQGANLERIGVWH